MSHKHSTPSGFSTTTASRLVTLDSLHLSASRTQQGKAIRMATLPVIAWLRP